MRTLDYILGVLDSFAQIAEIFPGITVPAALSDKILKIAQAAVKAHESATGQPLDLSLLQPLQPNPIPSPTSTPIAPISH